MISIKINGEFVDTDVDLAISFELNNDLFNMDDTLPRQFTYQVTLPATPRNNTIFGWLKNINSTTAWETRYEAEIIYPGLDIIAKCKVNKITAKGYEVSFFVGKSAFKDAGDKLMKELQFGGVRKIIDPYTNQSDLMDELLNIANHPDDHDFLFAPIIHGDFYNGSLDQLWIDLSTWYDINPYLGISNYFDGGVFKENWQDTTNPAHPTLHNKTNFIPFFKLKFIITNIFNENGYSIDDQFFNTVERNMLYVYNNFAIDWFSSGAPGLVECDYRITPSNHMPQLTVREFLNGFCKMFNVHQDYRLSSAEVKLVCREDIYNNLQEEDWTQKQNGSIEITSPDRNLFGFRATLDEADEAHKNVFLPAKTLEKDNYSNRQIIETTLSWPYFERHTDPFPTGKLMYISTLNQPGSSNVYPTIGTENPFVPKVMIYRGMQQDSNGNDYPYLSPSNIIEGGTDGDLVIDWSNENGLINTFYKKWLTFIGNARVVSMPLRLSVTDIANLDLTKRKRIDTATYFIKKISFTLTHQGIVGAKGDFYKI